MRSFTSGTYRTVRRAGRADCLGAFVKGAFVVFIAVSRVCGHPWQVANSQKVCAE